jgi:hypothetical protein
VAQSFRNRGALSGYIARQVKPFFSKDMEKAQTAARALGFMVENADVSRGWGIAINMLPLISNFLSAQNSGHRLRSICRPWRLL